MDYLKFLALTAIALIVMAIDARLFGVRTGFFFVIGALVGLFWKFAPRRYTIGYIVWLAAFALWSVVMDKLFHNPAVLASTHRTYTPQVLSLATGFWALVGGIVLHPACYGIGRLACGWLAKRPHRAAA